MGLHGVIVEGVAGSCEFAERIHPEQAAQTEILPLPVYLYYGKVNDKNKHNKT